MTGRLKRIVALASLLALCCAYAPAAAGQESSAPKRLAAIVYDGDMAALLSHLAQTFNVTLGLEMNTARLRPKVKISLRDATLQDVLDAVVRSEPGYAWRENEGFVDFYPAAGPTPLLDTVIVNYQVSGVGWAEAGDALVGMPEVRSAMTAAGLTRGEVARAQELWGRAAPAPGVALSLSLSNVTARRALHEITRRSGGHFWQFRRGSGFFSISNSYR